MADRPIRVQRKRTKGWRMPPNTVYVDRSTFFGNPWSVGPPALVRMMYRRADQIVRLPLQITAAGAVARYRAWLDGTLMSWQVDVMIPGDESRQRILEGLAELRGKNLACWCPLDRPCHADVLLEIANGWVHPMSPTPSFRTS